MSSPDSRIDHACDRFEEAWRAGQRPLIEAYLADSPEPDRPDLLRQLLRLEIELRRGSGEEPTRDEYERRFPTDLGVIADLFGATTSPAHVQATCTRPAGSRGAADGNLLFGILALQLDFIGRDALIAAMNAWVLEKSKPLGQILVEQGALSTTRRAMLEPLVGEHIREHGDDLARSLSSLGMLGSVRGALEQIPDADLHTSLSHVALTPTADGDPGDTLSLVGAPTTPGSRFLILRHHAKGGLGVVSVARDQELNREVALKEIQDKHADDPERRARFLLEAEITGSLEHPGIVPVYGLGHYPDGRPFYAMRFIQGESLKRAIEQFHRADVAGRDPGERSLSLRKLLNRFLDVCNAVAYAHSRGVLHRDLKPSNVMLGPYGETLVIDWGLAKALDRPNLGATPGAGPLVPASAGAVSKTLSGTVLGTPAYMSPEQAAGDLGRLGPASDVYSLGATLYHLLTGHAPVEDRDPGRVLQRMQQGDFPQPRQANRLVPPALESVCQKAMARRPENRYGTPRALSEDIEHWLADEPVAAHREGRGQRLSRWARRHRTWTRAGAAALVLVALVSVTAAFWVDKARRSEAAARKKAEASDIAERRSAREAIEKRDLALRSLNESKRLSSRLALDRGLRLCEQEDVRQGLLWLARSLRVAPADAADLQHVIRMSLGGWGRQFQGLLGYLRHEERIAAVAFSPDGKTILTGSDDRTARLWDAATARPIGLPMLLRGPVLDVAFSPDGHRVLTTSRVGASGEEARLWDGASGAAVGPPMEHRAQIQDVAFSPDGKVVVSAGYEGTAWLRDAASGRPIGGPLRHRGGIIVVDFSPDGRTVLTGSTDHTARLWDAATAEPIGAPMLHPGPVEFALFSPDGMKILTTTESTTSNEDAWFWDAATGQPMLGQLHHPGGIRAVSFNPDGRTVVTGGNDNTARLWDAVTRKPVGEMMRHAGPVVDVSFSPDGRIVLTRNEGTVTTRLWQATSAKPIGNPINGSLSDPIHFSPDSKIIQAANWDGTLLLWDATTAKPIGEPMECFGQILAISPDLSTFVARSEYAMATIWRRTPTPLPDEPNPIASHPEFLAPSIWAYSPDYQTMITADGASARLWDATRGQPIGETMAHDNRVADATFSPDGKAVVTREHYQDTGTFNNIARLWDAATAKLIGEPMRHPSAVNAVAFSPDNGTVLTGCSNGTSRLWDATTATLIGVPLSLRGSVTKSTFSPDGKTFAVAASHEARFFNAATAKPIGEPIRYEDPLLVLVFSPDSKAILTIGYDRTARLWEAGTARRIGEPMTLYGPDTPYLQDKGVAFSPDGKIVLIVRGATAQVRDVATAKPRGEVLRHRGTISAVAFSPDGKTVLTANRIDNTYSPQGGGVWLWEVQSGKLIGELRVQSVMEFVGFSPDCKIILTGDQSGKTWLWDAATLRPISKPVRHRYQISAAVRGGPKSLVRGRSKSTHWVWEVPTLVEGDAEQIGHWVRSLTNMSLEDNDTTRLLDTGSNQSVREAVEHLGGLPVR